MLVDVTIPFEHNDQAHLRAREEKERKYEELTEWCRGKYNEVYFGAFVVGALGSYDSDNERVLDMLGVAKGYRTLFRRLCVRDVLMGSHAIWLTRCSGRATTTSNV